MPFWIQVGNPTILSPVDSICDDLREAIEEIFPMETERAFLVWNRVYVPICYKYDLSILIDDLIPLLTTLLNTSEGEYNVCWGSNTFNAEWLLKWHKSRLSISTKWNSVVGGVEELCNKFSNLEIDLDAFLFEWKALLEKVLEALRISGVQVIDQGGYERLCWVASAIPQYGCLYRNREGVCG